MMPLRTVKLLNFRHLQKIGKHLVPPKETYGTAATTDEKQ